MSVESRAGMTQLPSSIPITSSVTWIVRSRSVPVTAQRVPVTVQQEAEEHRGGATAAADGTARRGQHLDQCIALGSELHRRRSFREVPQSFIVRGRGM